VARAQPHKNILLNAVKVIFEMCMFVREELHRVVVQRKKRSQLEWSSDCVQIRNILEKYSCSTFVVICQNLSNHKLIKLKRFVSTFADKLYN
jgi:hypothetical protein